MDIRNLVLQNRSYRRFDGAFPLSKDDLLALTDLGRLSPNGGNMQALRYALVCSAEGNAKVFDCLAWAGRLKEWPGPVQAERPTGYIIMLADGAHAATPGEDAGIAAQSILLGAVARGLGGCIFKSVNRKKLAEALGLPEALETILVIALGKPVEDVRLTAVGADGDIAYYRDAEGVHYVPKRALADVVIHCE